MFKQRFNPGDKVYITKNMPRGMEHFKNGCEAYVQYSRSERFDLSRYDKFQPSYSLVFADLSNISSWYPEETLILIEKGCYESLMEIFERYNTAKSVKADFSGTKAPEFPKPSCPRCGSNFPLGVLAHYCPPQ